MRSRAFFWVVWILSACGCGHSKVVTAADAGDGGALRLDGGSDAGLDCSKTCAIGVQTWCANQVDPYNDCNLCAPSLSSTGWSPRPQGAACTLQVPVPGTSGIGFCNLPPNSQTEYCTCASTGSACSAPTACCQGVCVDAGAHGFCYGTEGSPCGTYSPCLSGSACCTDEDGGQFCGAEDAGCP
jgi:hypothetical protein